MKSMKKRVLFLVLLIAGWASLGLHAAEAVTIKLRVYEGSRVGQLPPLNFVTSSYIQPTVSAHVRTEAEMSKEKGQIQRVFNLQDVNLLTEADLIIGEGGQAPDRVRHSFRLDGSAYLVYIILLESDAEDRYMAGFFEMGEGERRSILNTEMTLRRGHSFVFGFEDRAGKPYFCSFRMASDAGLLPPPPPPPPPPAMPPEFRKKVEEFERGAVKITFEAVPPVLLKMVDPVYPPDVERDIPSGSVILNVRIDTEGNVKKVMVLGMSDEKLNDPAVRAVRQWKYEPYLQEGRAVEAVFTVNLRKFKK